MIYLKALGPGSHRAGGFSPLPVSWRALRNSQGIKQVPTNAANTSDNSSSLPWGTSEPLFGSSESLCVAVLPAVPPFHLVFSSFRNEAEIWRRRGPTGRGESAGWGQPFPQELEHVARIQPLRLGRRTIYIQISLQLEPGLFRVAAAVFYLIRSKKIKTLSVQDPKILISNVVLIPESYGTRRKLLLSCSAQRVCFVASLTSLCWWGGRLSKGFVTAPVFVDAQETFVHPFGWRKQ